MTILEAIKERPLLMRGELVRATLEGRKTQTRRPMKFQLSPFVARDDPGPFWWFAKGAPRGLDGRGRLRQSELNDLLAPYCPHGCVGDRIWIKESFWQYGHYVPAVSAAGRPSWEFRCYSQSSINIRFEAPPPVFTPADRWSFGYHKRPSLFMERWMSRLTLEITDVRAQQIQDISREDAIAEGVPWQSCPHYQTPEQALRTAAGRGMSTTIDYIGGFRRLWDQINAKRGYSWASNCWVWAISFRVVD